MIGPPAITLLLFYFICNLLVTNLFSHHRRLRTFVDVLAFLIVVLYGSGALSWLQIGMGSVITREDFVEPWSLIAPFLSVSYLVISLESTGILEAAAFWLTHKRNYDTLNTFSLSFLATLVSSILLGPNIMIASGSPILIQHVQVLGLKEGPWLSASFVAANIAGMVLPWGNFTNLILLQVLGMPYTALPAYTILPFLACATSSFCILFLQPAARNEFILQNVPSSRHPESLDNSTHEGHHLRIKITNTFRKGRAIISATALGTCLVSILIGSLLNFSPWKVALFFTILMVVFDASADWYQFRTEWPGLHRFLKGRAMHRQAPGSEMEYPSDSEEDADEFHHLLHHVDGPREAAATDYMHVTGPISRNLTNTSPSALLAEDSTVARYSNRISSTIEQRDVNTFIANQVNFARRFPTLAMAIHRIPFMLIPLFICQLLLIEALAQTGCIGVFSRWLQNATNGGQMGPMIWVVGFFCVTLSNFAGTNIGAVLLLARILRETRVSDTVLQAAAVSLVVSSNIAPVNIMFSASYTGSLHAATMLRHNIPLTKKQFAKSSILLLTVMLFVGLSMVTAETAILFD